MRNATLVVLAGGRSSRFGGDKALEPWPTGRESLTSRALRRLAPIASRRVVVRAAPLPDLPQDVAQLADREPGAGPLQALVEAFAALPSDFYCVAPCDLPLLEPEVYRRLLDALERAPVACACGPRGREPLVSAWTRAAGERLAELQAREPDLALHRALAALGSAEVRFGPDEEHWFTNANTRDELASAVRLAGSRG